MSRVWSLWACCGRLEGAVVVGARFLSGTWRPAEGGAGETVGLAGAQRSAPAAPHRPAPSGTGACPWRPMRRPRCRQGTAVPRARGAGPWRPLLPRRARTQPRKLQRAAVASALHDALQGWCCTTAARRQTAQHALHTGRTAAAGPWGSSPMQVIKPDVCPDSFVGSLGLFASAADNAETTGRSHGCQWFLSYMYHAEILPACQ